MFRLITLTVLSLLCVPLAAETATIEGRITLNGSASHEGIEARVFADPHWGFRHQSHYESAVDRRGAFPTVKVSGSAVSDEDGDIRMEIEYGFEGEGKPRTAFRTRSNERVHVDYAAVVVVISHKGFATRRVQCNLFAGDTTRLRNASLQRAPTIKGTALRLSDRTPVGGLDIRVQPAGWLPIGTDSSWTFTTREDGTFEYTQEDLGTNSVKFTPLGDAFAFRTSSKLYYSVSLSAGETDLEDVLLVPGGSATVRVLDDEGNPVSDASCTISLGYGSSQTFRTDGFGRCKLIAVPEGSRELRATASGHYAHQVRVSIDSGEVLDVGDLTVMKRWPLEFIILSDGERGIEQFNVVATLLDGDLPYEYADNDRERPFELHQELDINQNTLTGLFRGKWKVTVFATNHVTANVEIDIPREEPLEVELRRAGNLKVELERPNGERHRITFCAVLHGSRHHDEITNMTQDELREFHSTHVYSVPRHKRPEGVFSPDWRYWGSIRRMPAGRYVVIGYAGGFGSIVNPDVEITQGETTELTLRPKRPVVSLTLTRSGKPAAGETVSIVSLKRLGHYGIEEQYKSTTDSEGRIRQELDSTFKIYVLCEREAAYIMSADDDRQRSGRVKSIANFEGRPQWGQALSGSIELVDPNRVWVTLKLDVPPESLDEPPLLRSSVPLDNYYGNGVRASVMEGGLWMFPPIPSGTHEIQLKTTHRRITREIAVDSPPEQHFEITLGLSAVNLEILCPEGVAPESLVVQLIHEQEFGNPFVSHLDVPSNRVSENGKVGFLGVESGRFLALATSYDTRFSMHGRFPSSGLWGAAWVDASSENVQAIDLTRKVGSLDLRVLANPAVGTAQLPQVVYRVQFFDDSDNEVIPGAYWSSFNYFNTRRTVSNIPVGTYRVRVTGYGVQPIEQENVVIGADEATELTLTPAAAGLLQVSFKDMKPGEVMTAGAKATLLDADGNEVHAEAPGGRLFTLFQPDPHRDRFPFPGEPQPPKPSGECVAHLLNLDPRVQSVLITMDGYEDIEIAVDVEPGRTIVKEVEPTPEAD